MSDVSVVGECNPPCAGRLEAMSIGAFIKSADLVFSDGAISIEGPHYTIIQPRKKNGDGYRWDVGASCCPWCGKDLIA